MKKKSLALALSLALIAVVGIGSTFAYFTDNDTKTNVVTMGHVDIELNEYNEMNELQKDGMTFDNIVPGETVYKAAQVEVADDSEPCYVRVKVEYKWTDENCKVSFDGVELNVDSAKWTKENDYYVRNEALKANDKALLFEKVTLPTEWNNDVADKEFKIILSAEAVQANFNDKIEWPGTVQSYTPASTSASASASNDSEASNPVITPANN